MSVRLVDVRARLVLVPGAKDLDQRLRQYHDRDGFPRSPYDIVRDLGQLSNGVPVIMNPPKGDKSNWSLLVHTRHYVTRLFATRAGDAYSIASLSPLRLRDHERLAEGHLLVRPRGWQAVNTLQEIPPSTSSGWPQLMSAWDALSADLAVSAPPTAPQEEYLSTLDAVIDATERITAGNEGERYPYREVNATGGRRNAAWQRYEFTLAGVRVPQADTFVQLAGGSRARGQVTRVSGMTVAVKFDDPVDWAELAGQGELVTTKSSVVYRMQRTAISQLRSGKARNPGVLAALVEGRVRPPGPGDPQPGFDLNLRQREAFRKALTVPELLVVLGPPGTGKTTTITEIVRAAKSAGERVIVCSHSNRAVDNVLEALPTDELRAIRVGNPERVTPAGADFLLDRHVADPRAVVPGRAARQLEAYSGLTDAQGWAAELARCTTEASAARAARAQAEQALQAERRAAGGPATEAVDRLTAGHAAHVRAAGRSAWRARWLARARDFAAAHSAWALIGGLLAMLASLCDRKLADELSRGEQLAGLIQARQAELVTAQRHLVEVTRDVPAVRAAATAAEEAGARAARIRADALKAARACTEKVSPMARPAAVRQDLDEDAADNELNALSRWLAERLPQLAARRELLTEWLRDVSGENGDLTPELIRYADVVAATTTGAGSRKELIGVDFGLAIVDEAGQIGVADTLIPLVRAERAVLVGDHKQLPPFLDSDVDAWGKDVGDPEVRGLLSKSALELVVSRLPAECGNVVQLNEQRRMPQVVADWISAEFYQGMLLTGVQRDHRDVLFSSPMTFVDTSGLPWEQRRDRSGREREQWGQPGYDNPAEARLLAGLAEHYHRLDADWAIIVPYRAQAARIMRLLDGRIGDPESLAANIGSVDSFQGGERNVILYGFTRSNPERSVGFLRELRRVNVAVTRVKQQLVMVGDLDTLTEARDPGFRALARSLRVHLSEQGSIVGYETVRSRLEG
jgi:hypothetical protein